METDRIINARLIEDRCELHYECGGLWSVDTIDEMFEVLGRTTVPLLKAGKPIYALGDFSRALPQDRATAAKIADHLQAAAKVGFKRSAIVNASALFKMQYRRVASGIDVEFFDNRADALAWLREPRENAAA